uniref:G-protein coupled receptors family 1 profile domain-containing protein n=1 Tax=Oryzias latipes TaxID=8090 RepID=A0A3P9I407_ORYLA
SGGLSNLSGHLHPLPGDLACAVVLGLGFVLGFLGNIAVIVLKPNLQHVSPVTQGLVLNLAVLDLLCVLTQPLWIYSMLFSWTLGLDACKFLTYLTDFSLNGSLMTVTLLSVQRYLVVVKQLNTLHLFGTDRLLVLLWIASFIASIPGCVIQQLTLDQRKTYCTLQPSTEAATGMLIEETTVGFIALFVVAFSYICIYRKVNRAAFFNNPQTTRLVSSIIVTLFVLYGPYLVMNIVSVTAVSLQIKGLQEFCRNSSNIVGSLVLLNSSLNPLLYIFTSCNFCKCSENLNSSGRHSVFSQRQTNITTTDAV